MKRVTVYKDERYPDYSVSKPSAHEPVIEISDELYAQVVAADEAYTKAQIELAQLYQQQKHEPRS